MLLRARMSTISPTHHDGQLDSNFYDGGGQLRVGDNFQYRVEYDSEHAPEFCFDCASWILDFAYNDVILN